MSHRRENGIFVLPVHGPTLRVHDPVAVAFDDLVMEEQTQVTMPVPKEKTRRPVQVHTLPSQRRQQPQQPMSHQADAPLKSAAQTCLLQTRGWQLNCGAQLDPYMMGAHPRPLYPPPSPEHQPSHRSPLALRAAALAVSSSLSSLSMATS